MVNDSWKSAFVNTPSFDETHALRGLRELTKSAPNLALSGVVSEERIASMYSRGAGLVLLYGLQRVNQEILGKLQELADERQVVRQLQAMFSGKPINSIEGFESEHRAVLHPVTRDVFDLANTSDQSSKRLIEAELQKLRSFFGAIGDRFDTMVFIGIGGSELGPHALAEALTPYWLDNRRVLYLANVDPDEMTVALRTLDLKKTLVVVVSKSGTTLETATNEARMRQAFADADLDSRHHFVSVTCPKTPMDDRNAYREVFHLFDFIGGRFSSTSVVGGVLICFLAGVNCFFELLDGANEMDHIALRTDIRDNLPLLLALLAVWNRNCLGYPTTAVIPYSSGLRRFPAHLQQCEMESNGKSVDRRGRRVSFPTGPVIWGEPGTNAQHSFFQLLHQGTDIVPIEFIGFKQSQLKDDFMWNGTTSQEKLIANLLAQALALAVGRDHENPNRYFPGNRPSCLILGKRLDARTLGALLALYEHKVAFQGFIWGINSFDQEGVQLGKGLAEQLLAVIRARREGREETMAPPAGKRLLDILDDLSSGHAIMPKA